MLSRSKRRRGWGGDLGSDTLQGYAETQRKGSHCAQEECLHKQTPTTKKRKNIFGGKVTSGTQRTERVSSVAGGGGRHRPAQEITEELHNRDEERGGGGGKNEDRRERKGEVKKVLPRRALPADQTGK